jgi:thiosulfate dehydrogenase [quinone] large subunit
MKARLDRIAPVLAGAIRITLGVLWLNEGTLKYRAGFGAADILLVADSAKSNTRVPGFFKDFADFALAGWPHLFGFTMPLLETLLGIALILGIFTLPVSLISIFTLMTYWLADQLITQYPIMVFLSAIVITWSLLASRFSATTLIAKFAVRNRPDHVLFREPIRRWL